MLVELIESWEAILDFIERGGNVLYFIMAVTFAMWTLIIERAWYFKTGHKDQVKTVMVVWQARSERGSWHAHRIRDMLIAQVKANLDRGLPMLATLVALCPLLGLLGTVTGMVEVFEVMAVTGGSNARAMAAGVSKATLPTMAGMVAALSGLYFSVRLHRMAETEGQKVADHLIPDM